LTPKKKVEDLQKDNLYAARIQVAQLSGTIARIHAHLGLKDPGKDQTKCDILSCWIYKREGHMLDHESPGPLHLDDVPLREKPKDESAPCPF